MMDSMRDIYLYIYISIYIVLLNTIARDITYHISMFSLQIPWMLRRAVCVAQGVQVEVKVEASPSGAARHGSFQGSDWNEIW